jgi:phage regulator Rha-like protein
MIKKGFSQMKNIENKMDLVFLGKKEELYTTSEVIAENAEVQHHAVQQLIMKYEADFREFGQVAFEMRAVTYSRGTNYEKIFHLTEEQATLLMTYLKNTERVRSFKKELVRQFYAMREILWKQQYERKTESWQTARLEGKKARRLETNEIKLFVEYAAANGSKQPQWYYTAFTKLAHTAVGITSGGRDASTTGQLLDLRTVERVISRAIVHEISNHTEYHQAFQNVKVKVLQVTALALDSGLALTA